MNTGNGRPREGAKETKMKRPRLRTVLLIAGFLLVLLVAASSRIVSGYWQIRSSNPVRRGMARAEELGCFFCHGDLGRVGIPIPGSHEGVPQWSDSVWMMYVKTDEEIRQYIAEGSPERTEHAHEQHAISMPGYGDIVGKADIEDLVATFKVLSGMVAPARGTPARSGYDLAREWNCFSCHAPGGSGGLPNPGSFAGFIPGWYGADFNDLVRDRSEFDTWILEGTIPRLSNHLIAKRFLARQKVAMPPYRELTPEQLDGLWAYTEWLKETDGGHRGEISPW
jgi:mono/diheme cytochrome c family protein